MGLIDIKNISKYYGDICVFKDVSLTIFPNQIHGLFGRNGVGKTTLLNLITNRVFPTDGEITIDGEKVVENDNAIGKAFYMTEKNLWPENMTVKRVFKWTKEFYQDFDMEYALSLCNKFSLNPNKKIKGLSTGYNSISKLITTLASGAEILIFDEPVLGLDAHHRDLFYKELLTNYIEKPKTIILSTHIIDEIADILERVIIIKDKKIAVNEKVEALIKSAYCVLGASEKVEKFIKGRNCVHIDRMANFLSATIVGEVSDQDRTLASQLNLELAKVDLQKLFIYLTDVGVSNNEKF